jgi:hypothetical protein
MRDIIKKILCLTLVVILFASTNALALKITNNSISVGEKEVNEPNLINRETKSNNYEEDIDRFVDLEVTLNIKAIRALDKIDLFSKADFYVKVFINGVEWFTTDIWPNQDYVYPNISRTIDVPDDEENVSIKIQLWDQNLFRDKLCDIGGIYEDDNENEKRDLNLVYSLKSGHWRGDDYNSPDVRYEPSGYGHANGCDDNTYNRRDLDCEIFFDITQNDFDGDGIPYWAEINYGTDPEENDLGRDDDEDGIPIEWEHKWGHYFQGNYSNWPKITYDHVWFYDPFEFEDHENLDPDEDGLQNIEEYLTSEWGSDPFRRDIFLEMDQMKIENGMGSYVPELAKEWFKDVYAKQNIVLVIDDHEEDVMKGGEIIPFIETVPRNGDRDIYNDYFLHNGENKWRQGIFHYMVFVYNLTGFAGHAYWGGDESYPYADAISISTRYHDKWEEFTLLRVVATRTLNKELRKAKVYAGVMMHETGHVLGIHHGNTPGCDNRQSYGPDQLGWWKYANYKSCMNYRYLFEINDYSDGSHGKNDFDDWARMDLTRFQG